MWLGIFGRPHIFYGFLTGGCQNCFRKEIEDFLDDLPVTDSEGIYFLQEGCRLKTRDTVNYGNQRLGDN